MAFEGKTFDSIEASDIRALQENAVAEGKTLEYKRDLPGSSDDDKRELLADVSSLANAAGGHLIFGVEDVEGVPNSIPGVTNINPDAEKLRLESVLRDGVAPRMPGIGVGMVPLSEGKHIPVIRVPRSWSGPHMVTFKNLSRFFSRNSAGKYQLDIGEIRSAFMASESVAENMKRFRLQRVSDVVSGQTPVPLPETGSIMLHSVPLAAVGDLSQPTFDLSRLATSEAYSLRTLNRGVTSLRANFDGIILLGSGEPAKAYVQVFRSGAIEIADARILEEGTRFPEFRAVGQEGTPPPYTKLIPDLGFEAGVIKALEMCLAYQRYIGVEPPLLVSLSLARVRDYRFYVDDFFDPAEGHPIDRDVLLCDGLLIEELQQDNVPTLLKSTFDSIWNAAGYPRSINYDHEGQWKPRQV